MNQPIVETKQGKVRGYIDRGISIFKGIPYAQAERFHVPRPPKPWADVLDATSYGFVCPVSLHEKPTGELMVPHRYWVMNENCQNLNIWTPGCDGEKRPVLVWIHGGAYEAGSAIEQVAYEGENMCRLGQIVVVSVNHRLNVLGFCDLSDYGEEYANSANAGMDDLIAALCWIRENIAAFGGDPGSVTLMGQSGGGAKITALLQMPAAHGLFHRGINMSGVLGPAMPDAAGDGRDLAEALMKELHAATVKELESIPTEALLDAYFRVRPALVKAGKYAGSRPKKNAFYMGMPDVNPPCPETKDIPMLVGSVFGEFGTFAPSGYDKNKLSQEEGRHIVTQALGNEAAAEALPLFAQAYPERSPVDALVLDFIFRYPTKAYIRQRGGMNRCTWGYLFNLDMPLDGGRAPWHCADIPFVFHNTELVPVARNAAQCTRVEKQIFDSVMAFVKTGNPNNPSIPTWPCSTDSEENTMLFGEDTQMRTNHDTALMDCVMKHHGIFLAQLQEGAGEIQH